MFPKLLTIIIALGITGCMLLVNRQQRIESAHEMTVIHRRLADHQETIWKLRAEVARRCSPDHLHALREELGAQWEPLIEFGDPTSSNPPPDNSDRVEWGG